MTFFKFAKRIKEDEAGAVTVDWVVLTAMTVGLGIAALNMIREGVGGSDLRDCLLPIRCDRQNIVLNGL